ncbi:S8 family serine peptidase [Adhaeribacter radiodurans]|uniref:S8 family serine peptidase n=1 Tax=Adhaeribacter radiodurans TaxID=2745197 RepID=A0A7L7L1R4_9BACT|nr:S8 family serine peptidase [Adhaeribacter radiodurans]QMU26728.1 S8 family serine peptidase [Adhaeribacter radiodurans]
MGKQRNSWLLLVLFILPAVCFSQKILPPSLNNNQQKLAPVLRQKAPPSIGNRYRVQVTNPVEFANWLRHKLPIATLQKQSETTNIFLLANLSSSDVTKILHCSLVKYVDVPDRIPQEELILRNTDLTANNVTAVHAKFPALKGNGLAASIKENPFDTTDIDLKNRIIRTSALKGTATMHATTMATLLAGAGNSAPSGRGVAPNARLASSDFSNLLPDDASTLVTQEISVQNHSYGVTPENYYGLEAQAYDQQCRENPLLMHVFSAGNAGDQAINTGLYANLAGWANLTGQFKTSKNTLSVGATDTSGQISPLSSRGPAYDGRIKPELVAFGEGGSSESAALVSGMALLVQQAYREQTGTLPTAALVKAAFINSADDLGRPEVDFEAGFGQADALGAVQAIQEKRFFTGQVTSNQVATFTIPVPTNSQLLKVTLVWHDLEAEPNAPKALQNDLDLTLINNTTNKHWLPWVLSSYPHPDSLRLPARRAADHLNNVEQITLTQPVNGSYEIQVKGFQVVQGAQAFSVVYEVQTEELTWNYPTSGTWLQTGGRHRLRWQNLASNPSSGKLEYRLLPHGAWRVINDKVAITTNQFDWQVPDTTAFAQLRLTTGNKEVVSDTFNLAPALPLQVGFNCGDEVLFFWPKQAGVSEYQIYQLGDLYLEPLTRTADTTFLVNKNTSKSNYYAVAPVWQGVVGPRSYTLDYTQAGCYVKSFLPRQLVTDTVAFEVELSTYYGVQTVSLEKIENGIFRTVQTISPENQVNFTFFDPTPRSGRNEYRVRVLAQMQASFYSQTEGVFYTQPEFIQLFPNPITRGNDVNIVVESDAEVPIEVYDQLGRKVNQFNELGVVKAIPTTNLKPGMYFIRVQSANNKWLVARLVVL